MMGSDLFKSAMMTHGGPTRAAAQVQAELSLQSPAGPRNRDHTVECQHQLPALLYWEYANATGLEPEAGKWALKEVGSAAEPHGRERQPRCVQRSLSVL